MKILLITFVAFSCMFFAFACAHFYYRRQYLVLKSELEKKLTSQLAILQQIHKAQATVINHLPALKSLEGTVLQHEKKLILFEEILR